MITYEDAKKIAFKLSGNVNACREYNAAYYFYEKDVEKDGDDGVVVLKDSGRALTFVQFILAKHPEKNPKEIDF